MSGHNEFVIGDHQLTIEEIVRIARDKNVKVTLSEQTKSKILAARKVVEELVAEKKVVYGVTTGFGMFKTEAISSDKVQDLQKNLIRSHAIGTGAPFSEEVVRAAILIRANSLSHGHSGVRLELIELLLSVLNAGLYPYVPCKGSVGASGDLAPLSHLTLVMMGEGEVWEDGARIPAGPILQQKNLTPIVLEAKEGLAMNNGTSFMTAVACLNVFQGELLVKQYDLILGLTLEAVSGTLAAYEERVHALRPHKGQGICAANIRTICAGSQILASYDQAHRVQDSYSIRCAPQVHGASRDALAYVRSVVETELNATTDNPLIFPETKEAVSAGHFHGQPISLVMDFLSMAMAELGDISERRSAKMVDKNNSEGLPAFLINPERAGLCNGYMIAQYTAAALVAENKVLCHPVCVDSIPTSANQEDHVSFGTTAARQCQEVIRNVFDILAIEAMLAAQGVEFRGKEKMSVGTRLVYDKIREKVASYDTDRIMYTDLENLRPEFLSGRILAGFQEKFGQLK